jgi:hypothetical protein
MVAECVNEHTVSYNHLPNRDKTCVFQNIQKLVPFLEAAMVAPC